MIHSTSKIHADLSFRVATYLRSNNHPCYIFSAGRLTPQKLGNFADIDVFIIIGCIRPMYLNGPFFVPVITVYELFCHLELCDFWDDMNTDDPERLTNFLINIKDETDEQSHISNTESNSISLTNIDYSLRSFASKEYKGVPHYMVEKIDEKSTPSIEILPGSTGLPREYHDF